MKKRRGSVKHSFKVGDVVRLYKFASWDTDWKAVTHCGKETLYFSDGSRGPAKDYVLVAGAYEKEDK